MLTEETVRESLQKYGNGTVSYVTNWRIKEDGSRKAEHPISLTSVKDESEFNILVKDFTKQLNNNLSFVEMNEYVLENYKNRAIFEQEHIINEIKITESKFLMYSSTNGTLFNKKTGDVFVSDLKGMDLLNICFELKWGKDEVTIASRYDIEIYKVELISYAYFEGKLEKAIGFICELSNSEDGFTDYQSVESPIRYLDVNNYK